MRGIIAVGEHDTATLLAKVRNSPSMTGQNLVSRVSTTENYEWTHGIDAVSASDKVPAPLEPAFHVVAYDYRH